MLIAPLLLVGFCTSQTFTMEGEASTISLVQDDITYTLYNEDEFSIVDSSSTPALTLNQSSDCISTFDRRVLVHGPFLASTSKSFKLLSYEQWKLVIFEDFQSSVTGWSEDDISNCGSSPDLFLGGHCKFSNENVTKTFSLSSHSEIKVSANFHFIDNWKGESAYMKVDGEYVWSESFESCSNLRASVCQSEGINVCGDDYPDRMGHFIRYAGSHSDDEVTLEFSSTLSRDSCEVSWGIDNIEIYIR